MAKNSLQDLIREYQQLGFDKSIIEIAYRNVDGNQARVLDEIFRLQQDSNSFPTKPSNPQDQDAQLSKAIEMSISEAKDKKISLEPLNPQQRIRKSGVPVGLKNIGNTCYFNSLLQTYFQNAAFVQSIISYEIPEHYKELKDEEIQQIGQTDFQFKKKYASCKLVDNLKKLFCSLIASDRKYIDPTPVLSAIVDDYGNDLSIGDQKDIGQFNLTFLSRIEDGLEEGRKMNRMDIQEKQNFIDSPSKISMVGGEQKQNSLLRRSSIRINQKSIIAQQFIGKIQNYFTNESAGIQKTEQEMFVCLFANVKQKELYRACQQITLSHIEDYRNDKGEVIGVQKHTWIKEAPKTLFFQIDRVVYDKANLNLHKINDHFDFPKIFYIDPFLLKNKAQAVQIKKAVRKLRKQKEQYINALQSIEKYGSKKLNLLDLLLQTSIFLGQQQNQMQVERQIDNPVFFSNLKDKIDPSQIELLKLYRNSLEERVHSYKNKIEKIEEEIQKLYEQIRSTPYHLYSILIHEGGADSGHYYSYTYDVHSMKWRKYNDINITEQNEADVMNLARGSQNTSAYYLVYAQRDVLIPANIQPPVLNYKLSNEEGYFNDYYSTFLTQPLKKAVSADNDHMRYEIEQYKMNSFATRVVDVYVKKFETCNEVFRKTKPEKKKNTPPVLINLPIFVKNIDEAEYKSVLLLNCIEEYGPKQKNVVFEELVKKKMSSFNEFKRPAKFGVNEKYMHSFINNIYWAISAKKLFECIDQEQYTTIFTLLKPLIHSQAHEYFHWLSNLLVKIFIVRLLAQAEKSVSYSQQIALEKIKIITVLLFKYTNAQQQKLLWINCSYWIGEISILANEIKPTLDDIIEMIQTKSYDNRYSLLEQQQPNAFDDIKKSVDLADALWNLSRQENTFITAMLDMREKVKGKMKSCNSLYSEMKKMNYPLKKQERDKLLNE